MSNDPTDPRKASLDELARVTQEEPRAYEQVGNPLDRSQTTVTLTAEWLPPAIGSMSHEEELRIGRERIGSVWKFAMGDGWAYACRSDISAREAPTRDAAKAALVAALNGKSA